MKAVFLQVEHDVDDVLTIIVKTSPGNDAVVHRVTPICTDLEPCELLGGSHVV